MSDEVRKILYEYNNEHCIYILIRHDSMFKKVKLLIYVTDECKEIL